MVREPNPRRVVAIARSWIGTPYQHQASARAGCDCLGLIRGVWREVYGHEPETPPPYSTDWSEIDREERLLAAARRWLIEINSDAAAPGAVLLFRMRRNGPCKHLGILTEGRLSNLNPGPSSRLVHAISGRAVAETALAPLRRRLAHAFTWPPHP